MTVETTKYSRVFRASTPTVTVCVDCGKPLSQAQYTRCGSCATKRRWAERRGEDTPAPAPRKRMLRREPTGRASYTRAEESYPTPVADHFPCSCGNAIRNVPTYLQDMPIWTCRTCANKRGFVQGVSIDNFEGRYTARRRGHAA